MAKKSKQTNKANVSRLIANANPKSPITEQFRTLRTNVQFSGIDKKVETLLITSAEPGAGKSMTAANLAVVYAQQGIKTLLIDADLRKPTMHYKFNVGNLSGLSNALVESIPVERVAKKADITHLDIITSGPIPPNPAELLASNKFKELLTAAEATYDMIIIDTPPLLAVTDAQVIAHLVGGVIVVARSKQTEVEQLKESVDLIKKAQGNLLGIVLNDMEKSPESNYYYYGN